MIKNELNLYFTIFVNNMFTCQISSTDFNFLEDSFYPSAWKMDFCMLNLLS